ncbi:MAG: hypothetical protein ACTHOU_05120 [Aureliella sp.]
MRLTLRTLLAYRDRVLKPAEIEDMHARVQQSAMAGNLLKRIEALSQRPTLLAPPVDGKGLGADANSIAEYLDDALKGEKVPELERICLESDVQLAELAQCHQLLSSALSATIEVPPSLRQRILTLGDAAERAKALAAHPTGLLPEQSAPAAAGPAQRSQPEGRARFRTDAPHVQAVAVAPLPGGQDAQPSRSAASAQPVEAPMLASGGDSIRPTGLDLEGSHLAHEVPEYLRGSTRDGWRGPLAIGGLVAVLALLVWQSIGSWDQVRELFASRPVAGDAGDQTAADRSAAERSERAADAGAAGAAQRADGAALAPRDGNRVNLGGTNDAAAVGARSSASQLDGSVPAVAAADSAALDGAALDGAAADSARVEDGNPLAATASAPAGSFAAQWLPADAQAMRTVLLVQATGGQPLHRMRAAERLPSGTQVFVPPACRPTLDLANGPLWTVCGATQLAASLPETGSKSVPRIDLRLGRALISAATRGSAEPQAVRIHTPDSQVLLTLPDASARVAVELSYPPAAHGPVTDRSAHRPVLLVAVVDGEATLEVGAARGQAAAPVSMTAGQSLQVARGTATAPETASPAPAWIDASSDRPVDALAAEDLERQLTSTEPIGSSLQKLVINRRPETRALAAETLALLGSWDWVTADKTTLTDPRDRSYWQPLLDLTRQVIAANPDDAKNLQGALSAKDPSRAAFQTEMWIGLTAAQLAADGPKKLVDHLDSDSLLDRILAIYQLQRLTGKDLGYQAGEVNRASVQQWDREVASGRLQLLPL